MKMNLFKAFHKHCCEGRCHRFKAFCEDTCSSLVCWPDPGTPRGSHCCCYSNLTLIYFQEINIGLSSVSYLHAVTAQTASVCVHSVNPGFFIDLDHKVLKGHFCINILNDQLSPFCLQYNIL